MGLRSLSLKKWGHEINNNIFHFNVYQNEILKALRENKLISFSAPTSFGKSYIVRYYIAKEYAGNNMDRCLIIVPTKALIDGFYEDLVLIRKKMHLNFALYTHARFAEIAEGKCVFILTQERLSFLISKNPAFVKTFDLVYCDEAHYISRGYRGFVLREVLRKLVEICGNRNKKLKYIFTSPIIKNPEYYKDKLFKHIGSANSYHKEIRYSPVEKNIHLIAKGDSEFVFYILHDLPRDSTIEERIEEIGREPFPVMSEDDKFINIVKDIYIVKKTNVKERTILFTTSPIFAHKYALIFADQLPQKKKYVNEIKDVEKYIEDHFDVNFGIGKLLEKGIGLHYGPMPIGLRRAMVELFEKGAIDYLICTPTLLEGVNLPAKNIFLFSDKFGGSTGKEKHSTLSFWNLIGRAGRITYGLSGNVYCIENDVGKYNDLLSSQETEIKDPEIGVSDTKTQKNHLIMALTGFRDDRYRYLKGKRSDDIQYLIYELITNDKPEELLGVYNEDIKKQLVSAIEEIKENIEIPLELLLTNPGMDPRLQDELYLSIKKLEKGTIKEYIGIISNPFGLVGEDLSTILSITGENLRWPEGKNKKRISNRLIQWIHEVPISKFIWQRLQYIPKPTDIGAKIEVINTAFQIIRDLDSELSYKAPKYFKCFFDVLLYVAKSKNMNTDDYGEKIETILFILESGISSPVGKYLFERGVARPIAIKVNSLIKHLHNGYVDDAIFKQPEIVSQIKAGMSNIAYKELMGHL